MPVDPDNPLGDTGGFVLSDLPSFFFGVRGDPWAVRTGEPAECLRSDIWSLMEIIRFFFVE